MFAGYAAEPSRVSPGRVAGVSPVSEALVSGHSLIFDGLIFGRLAARLNLRVADEQLVQGYDGAYPAVAVPSALGKPQSWRPGRREFE